MGFAQIVRTILVSYLHLPIQNFDIAGLIYYAINIPVLLLGMKDIGKQFFVKTICCLTAVTIFLSFIPIPTETLLHNDILGSTVIGALMCGFGMGTALRMGASLGGTDIIALLSITSIRRTLTSRCGLSRSWTTWDWSRKSCRRWTEELLVWKARALTRMKSRTCFTFSCPSTRSAS